MRILRHFLHSRSCTPDRDPRRADYWAYAGLTRRAVRWVTGNTRWPRPLLCGCLPDSPDSLAWQAFRHVDRDAWVAAGFTAEDAAAWVLDDTTDSIRYVTHLDPSAVAVWVLCGYARWVDLDPYDADRLRTDGTYRPDTSAAA